MGIIRKTVIIGGTKGEKEVEAIIDTAATFSAVPKKLADEVGISVFTYKDTPLPPDGHIEKIPVGIGNLKINGCDRPDVFYILSDKAPVLIGYISLQSFGAKVDLKTDEITITQCLPVLSFIVTDK